MAQYNPLRYFIHPRSFSCLQTHHFLYLGLDVLYSVPCDVAQLPFAHFQSIAFLDYFFNVVLQFSGKNLSGNFSPLGFAKFYLHTINFDEFLLESGLHFDKLTCKGCFLLFHVILDILIWLLKGGFEYLLDLLLNASELVAEDCSHSGVKQIDLGVNWGYLASYLHW